MNIVSVNYQASRAVTKWRGTDAGSSFTHVRGHAHTGWHGRKARQGMTSNRCVPVQVV